MVSDHENMLIFSEKKNNAFIDYLQVHHYICGTWYTQSLG